MPSVSAVTVSVRMSIRLAVLMRLSVVAAMLVRMAVDRVVRVLVHRFHWQYLLYSAFALFYVFAGYHSATLITHFDTSPRRII